MTEEIATLTSADESILRLRVYVRGAVQGVGFRPFIYRLAVDAGLPDWVSNTAQGLWLEVEGCARTRSIVSPLS